MARPKKLKRDEIQAAEQALWERIRFDYETKGTPLRRLAREYDIKSHATIVRRVELEGWTRSVEAMSAHFATEAVLDHLLEAQQQAETSAQKPAQPKPDKISNNPEKMEISANRQPVENVVETIDRRDSEQKPAITAAKKLASAQQRQLMMEIQTADLVIGSSAKLIKVLEKIMTMEDPVEIIRELMPFQMVGKMESFSGLMRAAISGVKEGVSLRRRALGMEQRAGYGQSTAVSGVTNEDLPEQVRDLLPNLSTDQLLELQRTAAMLNKKMEISGPRGAPTIDVDFEEVDAANRA
jgi:hypothetical protein